MSRSILVIETPENCEKCQLCSFGNYRAIRCVVNDQAIFLKDMEHKPSWCPLRRIPKKYRYADTNFEHGYNTCIDDIIGENE